MPRTVLIVDDSPTIRGFGGPELQELVKTLLRTAA